MTNPFTEHLRAEFTDAIHAEIAAEQVRHVPLEEYAVDSPHYTKLMAQMDECRRYEWPMEGL